MAKVYKIAECQVFKKYIKKTKTYKESISFGFTIPNFNTRKEVEKYFEDYISNIPNLRTNGIHYEKIAENTYKLTYEDCKNFRILSYQICEFTTEEEFI